MYKLESKYEHFQSWEIPEMTAGVSCGHFSKTDKGWLAVACGRQVILFRLELLKEEEEVKEEQKGEARHWDPASFTFATF